MARSLRPPTDATARRRGWVCATGAKAWLAASADWRDRRRRTAFMLNPDNAGGLEMALSVSARMAALLIMILSLSSLASARPHCRADASTRIHVGRFIDEDQGADGAVIGFSAGDFLAGDVNTPVPPWCADQLIHLGRNGAVVSTEVLGVSVEGVMPSATWRVMLRTADPPPEGPHARDNASSAMVVSSRPLPEQTWRMRLIGDGAPESGFEVTTVRGLILRVSCRFDPSTGTIVVAGAAADAGGSRPIKAFSERTRFATCPRPVIDVDGDGAPEVLIVDPYEEYMLYAIWPGRLRLVAVGASGV